MGDAHMASSGDGSEPTSKAQAIAKSVALLQSQVENLDVEGLQGTLTRVSDQIQNISERVSAALAVASDGSANASALMKAQVQQEEPGKMDSMEKLKTAKLNREKIEKMSGEVVDSNPYSRLMALQRMGIVKNYEQIRQKSVAIVGIGGVGSVAAEMLTRCGIGRLLLYDYDKVELANMNRLFFRPEHCGMTKTDAAAVTLSQINPDVDMRSYTMNVTTVEGFDKFKETLVDKDGTSCVDLVMSCVDNYEARMTVNQVCLELKQPWMESGVSEDAVSGHIQLMMPGQTACYQCVPPLVVASGIDEKTLKREGVCAASLPTTMGIVAGLLVQNALKYLLGFGQVSPFLGYNSLKDFFPAHAVMPNPDCVNKLCVELQEQMKGKELDLGQQPGGDEDDNAEVVHDENDWGIEVVANDSAQEPSQTDQAPDNLPKGLEFSMPATTAVDRETLEKSSVKVENTNVEDLMAQLANTQG